MDLLKMPSCFWENKGNIDVVFHCPYLVCKRPYHGSTGKFLPFDPIKCLRSDKNWTPELEKSCELLKRTWKEKKCGSCASWSIDNTGTCEQGKETGSAEFPACSNFKEEE
jgi:hypothetical protein